jgi:hypothetical protein
LLSDQDLKTKINGCDDADSRMFAALVDSVHALARHIDAVLHDLHREFELYCAGKKPQPRR